MRAYPTHRHVCLCKILFISVVFIYPCIFWNRYNFNVHNYTSEHYGHFVTRVASLFKWLAIFQELQIFIYLSAAAHLPQWLFWQGSLCVFPFVSTPLPVVIKFGINVLGARSERCTYVRIFYFLPFQNGGRFAGIFHSQGNALTDPHIISNIFFIKLYNFIEII